MYPGIKTEKQVEHNFSHEKMVKQTKRYIKNIFSLHQHYNSRKKSYNAKVQEKKNGSKIDMSEKSKPFESAKWF